jgi:hypothetical protein
LPGGSLAAVQKAIEAGRIRLINGKIDPEVADIQWERNTDPTQQKRGASGGSLDWTSSSLHRPPTPAATPRTSADVCTGVPPEARLMRTSVSRIREAARADAARAELLEYELEQKRGNLVRAEDVKRAAFEKARVARDALMAIPDRLAPLLAAESDPAKVHAILVSRSSARCALSSPPAKTSRPGSSDARRAAQVFAGGWSAGWEPPPSCCSRSGRTSTGSSRA